MFVVSKSWGSRFRGVPRIRIISSSRLNNGVWEINAGFVAGRVRGAWYALHI